jgi:hypothetical protein
VTGAILMGLSGGFIAGASEECHTDSCVGGMALVSIGLASAGIPLFIVGLVQRSRHSKWERTYQRTALDSLPQLRLGSARAPLGLTLESRF